jgi:hypothetical protein
MCYFFLCDKDLFILVTVLTVQRMAKADMLSGRPVGKRKDRQFVDDIAHCMSDAEVRYDKDEEWMTWWRETLLTVQAGLQRGWIHADSPVSSLSWFACGNTRLSFLTTFVLASEHRVCKGHYEAISTIYQDYQTSSGRGLVMIMFNITLLFVCEITCNVCVPERREIGITNG